MLQIEKDLKKIAKEINNELFKKSGGKKMYEYKFKTSQQDKVRNELIDKIKGIEDTFKLSEKPTKAEDITLERKELKEVDETKINQEAKDSLKAYLSEGLNEINTKYNTDINKIDDNIDSKVESTQSEISLLEPKYRDKEESVTNKSIKKGTNRGSILGEQLKDLDTQKDNDIIKLQDDAVLKINKLNAQKELLNAQKQNALDTFDIAYAVKLNEKIGKINEDLAAYNEKVKEYNNNIAIKESNLAKENNTNYEKDVDRIMDRNQQLIDFIAEHGRKGFASRVSSQKAELALEYLDELPVGDALTMLVEDADLVSVLGDEAFEIVLAYFKEKMDKQI